MTTIAQDYNAISFDGIEFPVISIEVAFSHDLGEHKFIFRDESLLQKQGRSNLTWKMEIPFSENHPLLKNLYTVTFPKFFTACASGDSKQLVTPDQGEFPAKCASLSYLIQPSQLDGVTVTAQFVHAPAIEDFDTQLQFVPSVTAADANATKLQSELDGMFTPDELPSAALTDPFKFIRSLSDQVLLYRDVIQGKWDAAIYAAHRAEDAVAAVVSTSISDTWALEAKLRQAQLEWARAKRISGAAGGQMSKNRVLTETSIDELARELSVTPESLIQINPELSASPIIASGTVVNFILGR